MPIPHCIFYDIKVYFEISVFEVSRADYIRIFGVVMDEKAPNFVVSVSQVIAERCPGNYRLIFEGWKSGAVVSGMKKKKNNFLLYFSMNYRDFSVKSKLIISLFQTVKLSLDFTVSKNRIFVK